MLISCAQLIARVRDRFDLERQSARHPDDSIVRRLNDAARDVRREFFTMGSRAGLASVVFDSSDAPDVVDVYPGQRIDNFADMDGTPIYAEKIQQVEFLDTRRGRPLPEITLGQASELYLDSTNTGDPVGWFPVGPLPSTGGATLGICVSPRLDSAKRFRVTYLPPMAPITKEIAGVSPVADVGIDELLIPLEWLMATMGVYLLVKDDDAQLSAIRQQMVAEAKVRALQDLRFTSTSEMTRGSVTGAYSRARRFEW